MQLFPASPNETNLRVAAFHVVKISPGKKTERREEAGLDSITSRYSERSSRSFPEGTAGRVRDPDQTRESGGKRA